MARCRWLVGAVALLMAGMVFAGDDPAVYLDVADTSVYGPPSALSTAGFAGRWHYRVTGLSARKGAILNAQAGGVYPDLTFTPRLRGRYNLYVGTREVDWLTGFQLKLGGSPLAATITPALATPQVHSNREYLWATNAELDKQTVLLHHIGRMVYFDYLKFVPVDADAPGAKIDPAVVKEEPLMDVFAEWRRTRDTVPPGMREIRYAPDPPPHPVEDTDGKGYVVYSRSYLDLIFPNTMPCMCWVATELNGSASRGEYEPLSLGVYAFGDLKGCAVKVSDLRSDAGAIKSANVEVAAVRCRNLRTTYYGPDYMLAPASLEVVPSVDVPKGQSRQFWLTVHVPEDARPGEYRGEVTVTAAGAPATRVPIRFRVFPFNLREPRDVALGMYDILWSAEPADRGFPRRRMADMRAHGMTTVAYCGTLGAPMAIEGGRATVKFDGTGGLEQGLDAYRDTRFPFPVVWMMGDDMWTWCSTQAEVGSDRFAELYKQLVQSIFAEAKKRHWPDIIFQPVDEPGSYDNRPIPGYLARWGAESELIKQAGGVVEADHIPLTTVDDRLRAPLARALPAIDIFTERYSNKPIWFEKDGWWWGSMKDQIAKWGKTLWSYNINDASFFPQLATMRFAYGYFLWLENVRGQLTWVYQDAAGNPLNALDGKWTDSMYRYPALPSIGEVGGPSLMWECMREGVDDYKYIYTLSSLADEARARGGVKHADEARRLLDNLRASFDLDEMRSKCSYIECQWGEGFTLPSGGPAVRGEYKVPNGWGFGDYDSWRLDVAREIAKLAGAR